MKINRDQHHRRWLSPYFLLIVRLWTALLSVGVLGLSSAQASSQCFRLTGGRVADLRSQRLSATIEATNRALETGQGPLEAATHLVRHSQSLRAEIALFVSTAQVGGLVGDSGLVSLQSRNETIMNQFSVIEANRPGLFSRLMQTWHRNSEARLRDSTRQVTKQLSEQNQSIAAIQAKLLQASNVLEQLIARHQRMQEEVAFLGELAGHFPSQKYLLSTLGQEASTMTDSSAVLAASIKSLTDQIRAVSQSIDEAEGLNSVSRLSVQARMAEDLCIARGYCPGERVFVLPPQESLQRTPLYRTPWFVRGATPAGELVVEQDGVTANFPARLVARTEGDTHLAGARAGSFISVATSVTDRATLVEVQGVFPDQTYLVKNEDMMQKVPISEVQGVFGREAERLIQPLGLRVQIGDLVPLEVMTYSDSNSQRRLVVRPFRLVGVIPPGHSSRTVYGGLERVLLLIEDSDPSHQYLVAADPLKRDKPIAPVSRTHATSTRLPLGFGDLHNRLIESVSR